MAAASGVTLAIDTAALPLLEGALALAAANIPGGNLTNRAHFGPRVRIGPDVDAAMRLVAFDPQTSGGLLMAVDPGATAHVLGQLTDAGVMTSVVGRVERSDPAGRSVRLD